MPSWRQGRFASASDRRRNRDAAAARDRPVRALGEHAVPGDDAVLDRTGASISIPPPSAPAKPAPVTTTVLSLSETWSSSSGAKATMPPPNAAGVESGFVLTVVTRLPVTSVRSIVAVACGTPQHWSMLIPPARASSSPKSIEPVYSTALLLMTLSSMSSAPTPPTSSGRRAVRDRAVRDGAVAADDTVAQHERAGEAVVDAAGGRIARGRADRCGRPAVLFVTRVLVRVRTPPLSIPPPLLNPHARGPQKPGGMDEFDITVSPVTMLFEIVTVAPVPLNGGWSSCEVGIPMPPPNVTSGSGCALLTPPVIVTPSIETFRASGAVARKIVTTGPPPLMTVLSAPAPWTWMLLSIVMPPENVPGAIAIVSPSCAAATAGCDPALGTGFEADAQSAGGRGMRGDGKHGDEGAAESGDERGACACPMLLSVGSSVGPAQLAKSSKSGVLVIGVSLLPSGRIV